ncbi:hypothetical protein HZF02_24635 [Pseudomonas yamanorum]|nr:hypothetical protein HZF02_24635 [Pseudomonas yamanorum]
MSNKHHNRDTQDYNDIPEGYPQLDNPNIDATDSTAYKSAPGVRVVKPEVKRNTNLALLMLVTACVTLFLILFPSDLDTDVLRKIFSRVDFKVFGVLLILSAGFVLFIVLQFQEYISGQATSSSFVDIDERASSNRIDAQISELRYEFLQFKATIDNDSVQTLDEAKVDENKVEVHEFSAIEYYIHRLIKSLDKHIETSEKKASKLLDTGALYLRRGIYFYVASIFVWQIVAHVWGVDKPLIYGVVSCSLTFLVVEFLAAWFLKQYRSFIDSSIQFMNVRSVFDRYLLSYYAIKEFSVDGSEGHAESKAQILRVLAEEIKWPEALNSKAGDMNHMVQMFESLAGILDKVKKSPSKSEQTGS